MADTCLRAMRCPVFRRRESHPGFRTELENLAGDGKGKGPSGSPARPKVPMRQSGADCLVVPMRRSNVRGGKGVGNPRRNRFGARSRRARRFNRQREEPADFDGRRQLSLGGTSRMSREAQVRICERLGAKFPGPTRRQRWRAPRRGITGRNSSRTMGRTQPQLSSARTARLTLPTLPSRSGQVSLASRGRFTSARPSTPPLSSGKRPPPPPRQTSTR
jgi:hypothetical protein